MRADGSEAEAQVGDVPEESDEDVTALTGSPDDVGGDERSRHPSSANGGAQNGTWWPFGRRHDEGATRMRELKQRIAELERTNQDLRRRKDLTELDEVELTELASETAIVMVRAAKDRQDRAARFVEELLGEARESAAEIRRTSQVEADELLRTARVEAEELRSTSTSEAERVRAEAQAGADDLLETSTADADRVRSEAEQYATELRERTTADSEQALAEAKEEARSLVDAARADAERLRTEAEQYATDLRQRSTAEADQSLTRARADAEQVRAEADQFAEKLREQSTADAEAMLVDVRARADAISSQAQADAEVLLSEAVTRRDELLESLEHQRRWIKELLQDADDLRFIAIDAFKDVRTLLDSALTKLTGPTNRAEQVVKQLDHEAGRLRAAVTPRLAPAAQQEEDEPQDVADGSWDADADADERLWDDQPDTTDGADDSTR